MKQIDIDQLAEEIVKQFSEWVDDLDEDITKIAMEEGKEMIKNAISDSPKKTGDYAKGWKMQIKKSNKFIRIKGVNKKKPELTWLLEDGHALKNGKRTRKFPHIYDNEKKANDKFKERVKALL